MKTITVDEYRRAMKIFIDERSNEGQRTDSMEIIKAFDGKVYRLENGALYFAEKGEVL